MDHTYVDAKNLKTLEELMINLVSEIATLRTLRATQVRAVEKGLLNEDQTEMANTIAWYIDDLIKRYAKQADSISEFLPPEFSVDEISERLYAAHLKKARALARKKS